MTAAPRRPRLVFRVYALATLLAIAVMVALLTLPRYMRGARYLEPQAALVQYMVERLSLKEPDQFREMVGRIEPRLRGGLSLYDAHGILVRSNVTPPLRAATRDEIETLAHEKWALKAGRIVVRSDDGSLIGVYHPNRPGFPYAYVLPLCLGILILVGAVSIWFSRRLARPLDQLATAARRFGEGDTAARAHISREDELGDVGRAFDEMAERTSAVLQAQRTLMGDVSHELRTPLARIRVALELAAEDPIAAKDVLADVTTDLDEIDQLINDILTTARLEGGEHVPLDRRPIDLGDLADRAVKRFSARHPHRKLDRQIEGRDRELECDPVLLRRAIDNLLDNAAKYSEPSTTVKLNVIPNGTRVAFEVIDLGIGMSENDLDRAFTPFWRADGSRTRKTGGVGLGLALARRIARVHGGDVTLTSVPGKGTTARLEVPLVMSS